MLSIVAMSRAFPSGAVEYSFSSPSFLSLFSSSLPPWHMLCPPLIEMELVVGYSEKVVSVRKSKKVSLCFEYLRFKQIPLSAVRPMGDFSPLGPGTWVLGVFSLGLQAMLLPAQDSDVGPRLRSRSVGPCGKEGRLSAQPLS